MPSADLVLLAFAVAAVVDWVAVAQERRELEWLAKPAALALLLLWAATGPGTSWALLAALAFSLLGDVYLMLPANLFAAGLAAFLVGHLFYIDAFDAPLVWRALWSAVVLAASVPLGLRIVRATPGAPLRVAVATYMAVIGVMTGSAIASGLPVAAAGALLFLASDSMIAWNRFVAPVPGARLAIIVTYHVGQALLVHALRA
jgi:uncharacterized membrane protein YhhN